jgi:putative Mg2+ transporter-C (MgtC) family protein
MEGMPLSVTWNDIALRLALTVAAGLVLGFNRSEHGKAAGMRTTMLVCIAASVAMIQVNLLLPTAGRPTGSFVMNDLMRLPLGILTGVGFIGGGAILRRGNIVTGVTTAATLWLATVVGLCFGGGQNALGIAATVLGLVALWPLEWIERALKREHSAVISIELDENAPSEGDIRQQIAAAGFSIMSNQISMNNGHSYRLAFKSCHRTPFRYPCQNTSSHGVAASTDARIVGDHSMFRP